MKSILNVYQLLKVNATEPGSQFAANAVQEYFVQKNAIQEFTKPSAPEQNITISLGSFCLPETIRLFGIKLVPIG